VTAAERFECSAASEAGGESLVGTASRSRFWLLVEQPGPWGHDPMTDSRLPADVGRELRERARQAGVRVLLIKQRDSAGEGRRCFLAYTGSRQRRIRSLEVAAAADLLDLDLEALAARRFTDVGEPFDRPLYLVCTHGKHDACCARRGGPLFRALRSEDAWECTHIGGDRFAGNLVCFPHGLYYGRVPAADGPRVTAEYAEGRVILKHLRGRSAFSPPVQAAEVEVRRRTGILGIDDLELRLHEEDGDRNRVVFRDPGGGLHELEVEVGWASARPLTCKSTHPHRPRSFAIGP